MRSTSPVLPGTVFPHSRNEKARVTLLAIDICAFGDRRRDNLVQLHLRQQMYEKLGEACAITCLPLPDCHQEDRGDGVLIIVPPDVQADDLLDPFAHHLTAVLRRYNRLASQVSRLQLRVAVHTGLVHRDTHGVAGRALIHLFRLLEAPAFKNALNGIDADLGMIVSDRLYNDAIDNGALINPDAYRRMRITCKETRTYAWVWFPPVSSR